MHAFTRAALYLPLFALAACGGGTTSDNRETIGASGSAASATASSTEGLKGTTATESTTAGLVGTTPSGMSYSIPLWTTICGNVQPASRSATQASICDDIVRRNGSASAVSVSEALSRMETAGLTPTLDRSNSLMGPDTNTNGVRDDIDRYIDGKNVSDVQKKVLRMLGKAFSSAITATTDPASLQLATAQMNNAVTCVWKVFPSTDADGMVQDIRKVTVNTRERYTAYMNYNGAVAGTVIKRPREVSCE